MPRSSFVSGLAWLSIVVCGFAVVGFGLQALMLQFWIPPDMLDPVRLSGGAPLPPSSYWVLSHLKGIIFGVLAMSVLGLWASIDLLRRRDWARWFFVATLALGALANAASLFFLGDLMPSAEGMLGPDVPPDLAAQVASFQRGMLVASVVTALVFVVVHAWIIWKLVTPPIRDEFR